MVHIPALHGQVFLDGFPAQAGLENLNERIQPDRFVVADIVHFVAVFRLIFLGRIGDDSLDGGDDVIDIGEITPHVPVIEDLDALAFHDSFGKGEVGHVRSPKGTVDGEEAQPRGRNPVEMRIGVGHQLIRFFRRCIEAHRMVHLVLGRVGNLAVKSIYRGGGGIDKVLDLIVAAGLQNVEKTNQVRLEVCIGIVDAVPYSSLCRQIDDIIDSVRRKDVVERLLVGKICLVKVEVVAGKQPQPLLFETHFIVVVQIVKADDRTASVQ